MDCSELTVGLPLLHILLHALLLVYNAGQSPPSQRPGPLTLAHVFWRFFQARSQSSIHSEGAPAPESI